MSYSNRMGNKGVWCPLKELYFPQIYAFSERERDDGTPLAWLYTLDPKVATLHSARPAAASISWIDRDGPIGRRTHSLVLRHHDTLDRAVGYLNGVEDAMNTCVWVHYTCFPAAYSRFCYDRQHAIGPAR